MTIECPSCHAHPGQPPTDYCTSLAHLSDVDAGPCPCVWFDPSDNDEDVCACGHEQHDGPCGARS